MTKLLTVGVIGKSKKENEKRVPIHPEHIKRIPKKIRKQITFEEGYGERFGMDDAAIANLTTGQVATREEIMKNFDCVILPKPLAEDLSEIREGAIVWGWPHCVQQKEITQMAINRKLTLIAWEEMFTWNHLDHKGMHIFYRNNEMAGYAGVNHAISVAGIVGNYGKPRKAAVLSFGSVSRGAIYALQGQGFSDITVYTSRPATNVRDQLPGIRYKQMKKEDSGEMFAVAIDGSVSSFAEELAEVQIIVNGTLQDTDYPKMFVSAEDSEKLMKGTLIIDVSCDEGMGFWCAKPTSFENPMFEVEGKYYYAVDHTPSFYWNSASWEISKALIPFLGKVMEGPSMWHKNKTVSKSIEVLDGVIQNPKILSFQNRKKEYPHSVK